MTDVSPDPFAVLTARERQVAEMLSRGLERSEIANALDIGIKTADTHRMHVLKKLGLRNAVELSLLAVRLGVVTPRRASTTRKWSR